MLEVQLDVNGTAPFWDRFLDTSRYVQSFLVLGKS